MCSLKELMLLVCIFEHDLSSALKFLLESGVDVNMQDDFSSVHRMARQKRYDPNAGILTGTRCVIHHYILPNTHSCSHQG